MITKDELTRTTKQNPHPVAQAKPVEPPPLPDVKPTPPLPDPLPPPPAPPPPKAEPTPAPPPPEPKPEPPKPEPPPPPKPEPPKPEPAPEPEPAAPEPIGGFVTTNNQLFNFNAAALAAIAAHLRRHRPVTTAAE